ncbi:MAG: AI-2E family transporter [Burkholderiales bacterium]
MNEPPAPDSELVERISARLLDVLIRAALLIAMAALCYRVFAPFLTLMVWAVILAVTMHPLHQSLVRRVRGRQGLAATLLVIIGMLVFVTPAALLMNSLGDSVSAFIHGVQNNTLQVGAPKDSVKAWPIVGERAYAIWSMAHEDLPALVQAMQPKIGEIARQALGLVGSIGGGLLVFLASFVIAGIVMAYGESGARASRAIFARVSGASRGEALAALSTSTIRAVAAGVLGVAFIQSAVIGLAALVAGIPGAGVIGVISLVFGIAQVPNILVTLPAIAYVWSSGEHGAGMATVHTIVFVVAGMLDNVLKPLMLGRGVDAPMPVIFIGALGGLASAGILGMFVGATLLALGYRIFMEWAASGPSGPT